ncbi:MAG: haloacid dehalogenase-like hydrolase [Clostridia bacterium]|nr:haloacid dehalogenase-like hydrolase [Clostridia bacterium]
MSAIIAVVWDFDKTLVDGYMEEPIFEDYGIDGDEFWRETSQIAERLCTEQGIMVNRDTYYLNRFIKYAKDGRFAGLDNAKLREYGGKLRFYPGAEEIFQKLKNSVESNPKYADTGIRVEHYIVSTGFRKVIEGSLFHSLVKRCYGCELIDEPVGASGENVISEIAYTIDNTTKTRALFEINKGVGVLPKIDVNTKIGEELRRIPFRNMIYVADGPSDIPAFSLVKRNGGSTFAVYPAGDFAAFSQVEGMRRDGRVQMFAEADYRENTTAYMWLKKRVCDYADRILTEQKEAILKGIGEPTPSHLSSAKEQVIDK